MREGLWPPPFRLFSFASFETPLLNSNLINQASDPSRSSATFAPPPLLPKPNPVHENNHAAPLGERNTSAQISGMSLITRRLTSRLPSSLQASPSHLRPSPLLPFPSQALTRHKHRQRRWRRRATRQPSPRPTRPLYLSHSNALQQRPRGSAAPRWSRTPPRGPSLHAQPHCTSRQSPPASSLFLNMNVLIHPHPHDRPTTFTQTDR